MTQTQLISVTYHKSKKRGCSEIEIRLKFTKICLEGLKFGHNNNYIYLNQNERIVYKSWFPFSIENAEKTAEFDQDRKMMKLLFKYKP